MKPILRGEDGETLKQGPPASGTVVIKWDAAATSGALTVMLETLRPGAAVPLHRLLTRDEAVFVHKGQGRATVNDTTMTVVPGMTIVVPRGAWYGLRNTGTGELQVMLVVSPAGLEGFFRELARAEDPVGLQALQRLAAQYEIELRVASNPPAAPVSPVLASPQKRSGRHHRRHRGGRGRRRDKTPSSPPASLPQSSAPLPPAKPAAVPSQPPVASKPTKSQGKPGTSKPRRERSRGFGRRFKEVYMGVRWVRVTGEGPVISTGQDRQATGDEE